MKKRILSIFLIICTVFFQTNVIFANEEPSEDLEAMTKLVSYFNIMNGDPDGNFRLSDCITRAEFSKVSVAASKYKDYVAPNAYISPFKDVKYTHWAAPYVKVAYDNAIISGYEDGTFRPDKNVTHEEIITVYLRLLGYTDEEFGVSWPYGQISTAADIGLSDGVDITIGANATRKDVLILSYNLLCTPIKGTNNDYISVLKHTIVEDVVLLDTKVSSKSKNNEISTSAGVYKVSEEFDYSYIGYEGDICVDTKTNKIVNFVPNEGKMEKHTVYNALQNEVVTYLDGERQNVKIEASTTVYDDDKLSSSQAVISKMEMGDALYVMYDTDSNVDYIVYKPGDLVGPVTVESKAWYQSAGINPDGANITRDGEKVSLDSIALDDIIYYSTELNMVMAYSKKVTGIYEKATPNKDNPTSVTVSGVTYNIESSTAFNALSSMGDLSYGDTVTLLIGKNGAIADARKAGEVVSNTTIVGYLMTTGQKTYIDQNNNEYSSYYVNVLLPDGEIAEYKTVKDYKDDIGEICSVTFDGTNANIKTRITGVELSGKVKSEERTIGKYTVSSDVKILDLSAYDTNDNEPMKYKNIYLQRLNGVTLREYDVLYASCNTKGEIDTIILDNVTGDAFSYGIMSKVSTDKNSDVKTYTCLCDGMELSKSSRGMSVPSNGEGVKVVLDSLGRSIYRITALNKLKSTELTSVTLSNAVASNGMVYTYSDNVQVYKMTPVSGGVYYTYTKIPLADLMKEMTDKSVTVYYDKSDINGGRVRVITVK